MHVTSSFSNFSYDTEWVEVYLYNMIAENVNINIPCPRLEILIHEFKYSILSPWINNSVQLFAIINTTEEL